MWQRRRKDGKGAFWEAKRDKILIKLEIISCRMFPRKQDALGGEGGRAGRGRGEEERRRGEDLAAALLELLPCDEGCLLGRIYLG